MLRTATAALFAATLALPALAGEATTGDIAVTDAYAFATPPTAKVGGAYMTVTNNGTTDDRILGASADFATAQLHLSQKGEDGVMRMVHQEDGVPVPAGETVTFAPGALHVMLMGLDAPLATGETQDITLTFEQAGEVTVPFDVRDR